MIRKMTNLETYIWNIYGNTDSAAMQTLRKMYRNRDNFVILGIEWKTWK